MLRPIVPAASAILLTLALVGCGSDSSPATPSGNPNSFTDPRDGTVYPTVTIGSQVWFAKNLVYRGTGSDTLGSCYERLAINCATYGRVYTWAEAAGLDKTYNSTAFTGTGVVQGACPVGWHLPSNSEWVKLDSAVHGNASRLKSKLWDGSDSSGFGALPGGGGKYTGGYADMDSISYFWTSTNPTANGATYWYLKSSDLVVYSYTYYKTSPLPVRCLKN